MTRPLRASTAKVLTRSPEPRRPLLWSVEEWDLHPGTPYFLVHEWQCFRCESGTGLAPTIARANQDASIHFRTNHEGPTP